MKFSLIPLSFFFFAIITAIKRKKNKKFLTGNKENLNRYQQIAMGILEEFGSQALAQNCTPPEWQSGNSTDVRESYPGLKKGFDYLIGKLKASFEGDELKDQCTNPESLKKIKDYLLQNLVAGRGKGKVESVPTPSDLQNLGAPPQSGPPAGGPAVGGPAVGGPAVGGPAVGGPVVGGPLVGGPQAGAPPQDGATPGAPSTPGAPIPGAPGAPNPGAAPGALNPEPVGLAPPLPAGGAPPTAVLPAGQPAPPVASRAAQKTLFMELQYSLMKVKEIIKPFDAIIKPLKFFHTTIRLTFKSPLFNRIRFTIECVKHSYKGNQDKEAIVLTLSNFIQNLFKILDKGQEEFVDRIIAVYCDKDKLMLNAIKLFGEHLNEKDEAKKPLLLGKLFGKLILAFAK